MSVEEIEFKDICIKIDFEHNSHHPQRVFDSMSHLISSIELFHLCFLNSVAVETQSEFLLSNVKEGSLESWLSLRIKGDVTSDKKRRLADYLNRCTELVLEFIYDKETIKSIDEIDSLEQSISSMAHEMDLEEFPNVFSLDKHRLLKGYSEIGKATNSLNTIDEAYLKSHTTIKKINKNFYLSDEELQSLVVDRIEEASSTETLIVKKPDLLGNSMWDFMKDKRSISAKLLDPTWLNKFHQRRVIIAPGDALYCDLLTLIFYDKKGEIIDVKYQISRVHHKVDLNFQQLELDNE
ncbi:hypothetical protein [Pseudoalteromonas luteoviolacea]|uniref:Uncharacterized protein n=1 Tax=Pseudoalteromonas luteoviolacea S4054 TaxID=1129367 RepID=A0A0F6AHJ9_9GAMM|nr:hypothetical protein [Pseudoalteromonas luteoviolacea]AOT10438.1 hypothetical protein S4054249_21445 [Pseudoalteromonas luteoviolacea]AOT15492.1 hypothetical protein S40542_22145 [Pseudoalteromonas luteoviolacea]AOT20257.1 hypothetical protein S4054_21360 [Pseudoalteromonas luteoviolacea]KKE85687.1 hypothetical protein N479_25190 [Pseudoalteromonas luteoviolacea S4054]KZN73168.1 hypothetical protein N481_13175 [Pseudoalteromonas luteoviolacea S4047-1]